MGEHPQTTRILTTNYSQFKKKVMMENTDHTSEYTGPCDGQLQLARKSVNLLSNTQIG